MRFVETGKGSFFGDYIYDQVVPKGHFFRQLQGVVDWSRFTERLIALYKGGWEYGRAPYDLVVMLKMLLVAYLYNLSERQVESYVNENLPAKWFVGLAVDRWAPDHSSLTEFKGRLVAKEKLEAVGGLLGEIVGTALAKGIRFGSIQVVDSVHSVANVNTAKDEGRKKDGKGPRDLMLSGGRSTAGRWRTRRVGRYYRGSTSTGTRRT